MIILGLGSNLNDRLANLRQALHLIKQLPHVTVQQVSPVYTSEAQLPNNAPTSWHLPYLNVAIRCETDITPIKLLAQLQKIEEQVGRLEKHERWAPRNIDIDILAWGDLNISTDQMTIPHKHLFERPFALWPLADVAPFWVYQGKTAAERVVPLGSRFSGDAPFHTHQILQRIDTPELVGIINATPDSFSDGGQFLSAHKAMQQAMHLVYSGATVIDIGAESTAPNADNIDPKTEWERLEPVLQAIHAIRQNLFIPPKVSVDTRNPDVAAKAMTYNIDWINDVSGLDNPLMQNIIASCAVDCVVMHHLALPENRELSLPLNQDPVELVFQWGQERIALLEKQGINRSRIIFDPGLGFGKTAEQSFCILQNIGRFKDLGVRVMIGHSRKSFLGNYTALPSINRDIETTAVSLYLARSPIDYMRLHNVEFCARAIKVQAALTE